MSDPVRLRILMAVKAAMQEIPGIRSIELNPAADPTRFPALSIVDRGDTAVGETPYSRRWALKIEIIGDVTGDGGDGMTANCNELLGRVRDILDANTQWGGLASRTDLEDTPVETVPGASIRTGAFRQDAVIQYAHRKGDSSTPSD